MADLTYIGGAVLGLGAILGGFATCKGWDPTQKVNMGGVIQKYNIEATVFSEDAADKWESYKGMLGLLNDKSGEDGNLVLDAILTIDGDANGTVTLDELSRSYGPTLTALKQKRGLSVPADSRNVIPYEGSAPGATGSIVPTLVTPAGTTPMLTPKVSAKPATNTGTATSL